MRLSILRFYTTPMGTYDQHIKLANRVGVCTTGNRVLITLQVVMTCLLVLH